MGLKLHYELLLQTIVNEAMYMACRDMERMELPIGSVQAECSVVTTGPANPATRGGRNQRGARSGTQLIFSSNPFGPLMRPIKFNFQLRYGVHCSG